MQPVRWLLRLVFLTLVLFVLYAVDFWGLGLAPAVRTVPLVVVLVALLDTAVTTLVIMRSRRHGWALAAVLFLAFYALKTVLVAIEAAYLTDVFTPGMLAGLLLNGALAAAIFAPLAVWTWGRWRSAPETAVPVEITGWRSWLWKVPLLGVVYAVLFVAAGLLVFQPLARALDAATAEAYFAAFQPPAWILLFVVARGILWVLLTLPLVVGLNGRSWRDSLAAGLFFGVLMASSLMLPSGLPDSIWPAHLLEVFAANFIFGVLMVWLLAPRARKAPEHAPAGEAFGT